MMLQERTGVRRRSSVARTAKRIEAHLALPGSPGQDLDRFAA